MKHCGEKIGVIGLGYVGLPLALALSKHFETVGFDTNSRKIEELTKGIDKTGTFKPEELVSGLKYTCEKGDLAGCTFIIVAVPTPIDSQKRPDLTPLIKASQTIGDFLHRDTWWKACDPKYIFKKDGFSGRLQAPSTIIVFESTVYPGVTEDVCGKEIVKIGDHVVRGRDFKLGYSPERINPGDTEHTLEKVTKVISGDDAETVSRMHRVYSTICENVYVASSIKVAEAAKVIENTQRDLNIALMNELALIFDRMGLQTKDVLDTAATKWNFMRFSPGLVGGHCIGVDPYYLTTKAEELGYRPEVILAGRRINDSMGHFIAQKTIKLLVQAGINMKEAQVGILGLTFKENVPDIRNSRVPDIITELQQFGIKPLVCDPMADADEVLHEYGIVLTPFESMPKMDAIILAVPHAKILEDEAKLTFLIGKVLVDVKSAIPEYKKLLQPDIVHWCL